ncbi:MAG: PEGA domain-containing protein [Myxococcales bacterium]|nr:PEGA domain-containing protein [Myxococcales bacterium]
MDERTVRPRHPGRGATLTLLLCGVWAFALPAMAQTAAMLPAQRDVKASGEQHAEAMGFVYEMLVEQGVHVVADEDEVEKRLLEKGLHRECQSATNCGPKIAQLLGVDFVVSAVVWTDQSYSKRPQSVAVGLVTPEGASHNGAAPVHGGNLREAARQATLKALSDRASKQLGWLVVQSEPMGASVELDGKASGKTPYKRRVAVGSHTLKLRLSGYLSPEQTIKVTRKGTAKATVRLSPRGDRGDPSDDADGESGHSSWWWSYGAPITVGAIGLAGLLTLGGVALIATGCDTTYSDGACHNETKLDSTTAWIWGGISGALLLAGGGWLLWNLNNNDTGTQGSSAQLRLTPMGASVQGRF